MLRIAALVAGALAGFVASLILAVGALEVSATSFGGLTVPQLALARYALIFIANLSLLGAGVTLALPRTGAALLLLAAIGWVGAALSFGHGADLVLIAPPSLGIVAFALAIASDIATRRSPRTSEEAAADAFEPDPYDVAPTPQAYREQAAMGVAAQVAARDQLSGMVERDFIPGRLNGKRERPVADDRPAFREIEEDVEPTFLGRLGRGVTGLLSFGLYAAAAGAVLLVVYNIYQRDDGAALVTGPASSTPVTSVASIATPAPSSSAPPAPAQSSSSQPVRVASTELRPAISSEPPRLGVVVAPSPTTPTPRVVGPTSSVEPVAVAAANGPVDLEPVSSSEPPVSSAPPASEPPPAEPAPGTSIDPTLVAPVPATMSPALAAARNTGGAPRAGSDL